MLDSSESFVCSNLRLMCCPQEHKASGLWLFKHMKFKQCISHHTGVDYEPLLTSALLTLSSWKGVSLCRKQEGVVRKRVSVLLSKNIVWHLFKWKYMSTPEIQDFIVKTGAPVWKTLGAFSSSSSVTYLLQRGLLASLYTTNVFFSLLLPAWTPSMPF